MKFSRLAHRANPCGTLHPRALEGALSAGVSPKFSLFRLWNGISAAFCFAAFILPAASPAMVVSWNPNPETNIAGYRVHYGTTSGNHTTTVDAGAATRVTIPDLPQGGTYYIVVTAINTDGLESPPSVEISHRTSAASSDPVIPQSSWTLQYVDSQEGGNYAAAKAFDGNTATFWHTAWTTGTTPPPHEIQIDLGSVRSVKGFRYLPRQDNWLVGNIGRYEFYTSLDGSNWGTAAATGTFANNAFAKEIRFTSRNARYVRLKSLTEAAGGNETAVAELNLIQGDAISPPPNQAPVASAVSISTQEDTAAPAALIASDADGNPLTYTIVSQPSKGALTGTAPSLTYTPNADTNGSDSFTYKVNDGSTDSNTATVNITINAVNDPPSATSRSASTNEDTPVAIALTATDKEGSPLTYTVTAPAKGVLTGTAPSLTYTPNADANGPDSFTFKVSDGSTFSNTATVNITINAVNDPPVVASKSAKTRQDTPVAITLTGTDKDSATLTYSIASTPSHGALSGTPPNLTYTPAEGFTGADSFTYKAGDGSAESTAATVSITVDPETPDPDADVIPRTGWRLHYVDSEEPAGNDAVLAFDGNPATFWHTRWKSNATPAPHEIQIDLGAVHTIHGFRHLPRQDNYQVGNIQQYEFYTSMDGSNWGTASASGVFPATSTEKEILIPAINARFIRLRALSEINAGLHTNCAEINILGTPAPNEAPVAAPQTLATTTNSPLAIQLAATDPENDPLTYQIVSHPSNGVLSGTAPNLTYTPATDFTGSDSFTFQADDGDLLSNISTVTIGVSATGLINFPPIFTASSITLPSAKEDTVYPGSSIASKATDPDPDDTLVFSKPSGPSWLAISSKGALSGKPPVGSAGTHRFTVRATDPHGLSADATLLIEIKPATLPLPWDVDDIGSGIKARATYQSGTLALEGAGRLTGSADAGAFVWQTLSGDGAIICRVHSLEDADEQSRIGLMIRSSLAPNSKHVFIGINGDGVIRVAHRVRTAGETSSKSVGKGPASKVWLRLVRKGDTIAAYKSPDGKKWSKTGAIHLDLAENCYIGMVVSGGKGNVSTAKFRDVKVSR